ncbi:FG-GAP repeat domain-containing protein [Mucilaginibacter endophyticus]|uniref:FG-GAP repeat domain-containing protein n=1 Tax=Mucilaginibacter endophyticus TaxID=2675003 RepID=UPI0013798286|nr:FG-GAP-like repeat-containing protein [Mucilaginibacter endophyticus]
MINRPDKHRPAKVSKAVIVSIVVLVIAITIGLFWYLQANKEDNTAANEGEHFQIATVESIAAGKVLAQQYCTSCHMLPDPALLNRFKWKNVFPQMGLRMGIKNHRGESYVGSIKGDDLVVPSAPVLNNEQWQDIIDYYMNTAPIKLPPQNRPLPIKKELPFFAVEKPQQSLEGKQVLGSYVKIDNSVKPARIFIANGQAKKLYLLSVQLKIIDSIATTGPVVDILFDHGNTLVCTIGKDLGANSDKLGTITQLTISAEGKMRLAPEPTFSKLGRPVQILAADINGDNKTDYVICEFGSLTGELCWMENIGNGNFTKHVISTLPGAIKAYIDNQDGKLPGLYVLFAQGEEGIFHFTNKGNGKFEAKEMLRFPAIYGSSYFEMVDINHDGYKDIVYTCGDNGNATLVLKPYHGVYIFINDGKGNYKQQYFYPINGCYKAIARDFDGDGNIDIATVSLFTDARQPEEGFVYLKGTGGLNFTPYALSPDIKFERAVTLDAGDINGDNKLDLLIGNAYFDFGPFGYNVSEPLFYALKNVAK